MLRNRLLWSLALLPLGGCDGALLQGLGEALVLVALVGLAILAVAALAEAAVLVAVARRALQGKAVGRPLQVGMIAAALVHGALVAEGVYGAIVEQGVADPFTWIIALSLVFPLCGAALALGTPAPPGSAAWQARIGACVAIGVFVAGGTAMVLWPWTEKTLRPGGTVTQLSVGYDGACILTSTGEVACWGDNEKGQTGTGLRPRRRERPSVVPGPGPAEQILGAGGHTCALSGRRLWCWGDNEDGTLGPSLPAVVSSPTAIPELGDVAEAGVWKDAVWAREAGGRLVGFGKDLSFAGERGPLALGNLPPDTVETAVAPGWWCARRASGEVRCAVASEEAFDVGIGAISLVAQENTACAVLKDGTATCWEPRRLQAEREQVAENRAREAEMWAAVQAARGASSLPPDAYVPSFDSPPEADPSEGRTPVPMLTHATRLAASEEHLCALTDAGQVWCWGTGFRGELGDGLATNYVTEPVQAVLPAPAVSLHLGEDLSCAFLSDQRTFCWGSSPPGAPESAFTLCHDTWLGALYCVPKPVEVTLLR